MSDAGSPPANPPPEEAKPKPEDNTLNIKITSTDGNEVFFKIKRTTKLNKLKAAYADRVGADAASIRILDDQTANDLDLEDGDSIEVLLEQVGGA
ncbi:MAG: hypothetical protein TREMPRED_002237 [Tremellales sp. Tagirdzhanova-0007]|nr:MAG: hypothetical protein TREMPRED_002237 [Tremellales sp. Tagirdzhanova-0007]